MSASFPSPSHPGLEPAASHPGLEPGVVIGGKYRIDGFLGAGGMGVVLSATHLELDAPVAIKIVRDELAQNEDVVASLTFEARAAARMRSVHIVRVLDVARLDSGAPYIVMEQLQGSDLATLLSERRALSVAEAVSWVLQACDGLAEAHALGIIHRDLKPENLFLATTPEGVVLKILDFGISKDIGASVAQGGRATLTKKGSAVGSPYYMSPEQMRAAPDLDARADVWSLGAILFELVTGSCPFEADSPALLCTKVMVEAAPSLSARSASAPKELDAIVSRCLEKDPAARYATATQLADALREFVAGEESVSAERQRLASGIDIKVDVPLASPPRSPRSLDEGEENPFKRKHKAWPLLGMGVLLLAAGVIFWRLQSDPDDLNSLGGARASASEVSRKASPSAGPHSAVSGSLTKSNPGSGVEVTPLSPAPSPSVSSTPAASSREDAPPARNWNSPKYTWPPPKRAAPAGRDLDSVGSRYDL